MSSFLISRFCQHRRAPRTHKYTRDARGWRQSIRHRRHVHVLGHKCLPFDVELKETEYPDSGATCCLQISNGRAAILTRSQSACLWFCLLSWNFLENVLWTNDDRLIVDVQHVEHTIKDSRWRQLIFSWQFNANRAIRANFHTRLQQYMYSSGIILAWIFRAPMAHRKNLRAPFFKDCAPCYHMSQIIAENTPVLGFWCHLDQLKFTDNHFLAARREKFL